MDSGDLSSYRALLVDRLRALVDARGYSITAVEKELARGRGYVADALRGDKKLTVEVILEVLATVNVPPAEFFERPIPATPGPPRRRGRRSKRQAGIADAAPFPRPDSVSPLLQGLLLFFVQRGLLRLEDLEHVQRELSVHGLARSESSSEKAGRPEGRPD